MINGKKRSELNHNRIKEPETAEYIQEFVDERNIFVIDFHALIFF